MANGWGGKRANSGPKPGAGKFGRLRELRRATAAEILAGHDEHKLWARFLVSKDEHIRLQALIFLTVQRDGRAFQQLNPAHRLPADNADPKLSEVLRNLLPPAHSAAVTVTEKQTRIDLNCAQDGPQSHQDAPGRTLESKAPIRKAKRLKAPSPAPANQPVTIDASTASDPDPSGREKGVGQNGAESHTERNQDPEK